MGTTGVCETNDYRDPMNLKGLGPNDMNLIELRHLYGRKPYKFIGLRWALFLATVGGQLCWSSIEGLAGG